MTNETKGCKELISDVIAQGLCCYCGACSGSCPYLASYRGRIVQMENCTLDDGQCYQYCPRTPVDMDEVSEHLFGAPYGADELGTVQRVCMARSANDIVRGRAQYGGTVTTLLTLAMDEGLIDSAILTQNAEDKSPVPFVAKTQAEILQAAGSNYMACSVLEAYNRLPEDTSDKLAIVSVPCQALAAAQMRTTPPQHRCNPDNIAFVIGLFCTWALSSPGFHEFLKTSLNLSSVTKFDIPPPPAKRFDAFTPKGTVSLSLEQIREYTMPTCAYCLDMTAEFADVSVGSVEGIEGWNTVITRTDAGAQLLKLAEDKGVLETDELPGENLAHLKEASLLKKKRGLKAIVDKTGSQNDLLYVGVSSSVSEKLLS